MSEQASRKAERQALGERLRTTAKAVGLTSDEVAEALGVQGGSVRGWWVGRNEPSFERLKKYAQLVRVSVNYLLLGAEEPLPQVATLQEWRLRFADLVRAGVDPAEAIDRIAVPSPADTETLDRMTGPEREALTGAGPAMRAALEEVSGGQWEALTADQRQAVLQLIEVMARGNRPDTAGR